MNIKQYTDKKGKTLYQVKGYIGTDPVTGKKKSITRRGFKTKKDAENTFMRLKLKFKKEGKVTKRTRMKFKEVSDLWLELYKSTVKPTTFLNQSKVIENHILPVFGDMYVDKITMVQCQQFNIDQSKKLIRFHNSCNLLYKILKYAVHLELIERNPATNVIRPRKNKSEYVADWYSKDELNTFIDCLEQSELDYNAKAMLHLIAYTGMRKGEAMALYWSDIDFKNNTIKITKTAGETIEGYTIQEHPKTDDSIRTISIDPRTAMKLKQHQIEQKRIMLFHGININKSKNQLVFCNSDNKPLYGEFPNHHMNKLIKHYGLRHIMVHELRHTHASILFEAGATIKEVQERLGHKNHTTTYDIYLHVSEQKKEKTAETFVNYMNN